MQRKKDLRKSICLKLKELTGKEDKDSIIYSTLFHRPEWKTANTIGVTVSTATEINTRPIIERAWKEGKTIAVPKCIPSTKGMDFRKLSSYEQLEVSYYSLLEPNPTTTEKVEKHELDLVIVPGTVFDTSGFRIGFGGGYYDRFLSTYNGVTISIAYDIQVISQVPNEDHDLAVDLIITENKVLKFKNKENMVIFFTVE
ncbi:MAG: 5-formyltetrahydrofolate cyclo-ligase [Bacillaceae bacterium]|nr:5-formyltetrahydrofolate cyclo-ligase [Bacillaceae bacterium]